MILHSLATIHGWRSPRHRRSAARSKRRWRKCPSGRPWFAGQYAQFHAALASGEPFPVTLDDARASLELITALFHASETGAAVTLPIGPAHPKYNGWVPATERIAPNAAASLAAQSSA